MDNQKILRDLRASLKILEVNIALFKDGTYQVYPVIATELRKLICDKNISNAGAKDNSLLKKIFTFIPLHQVKSTPQRDSATIIQLHGSLKFDGKGSYRVEDLFDFTLPKIELKDWLQQEIFFIQRPICIADFIKSIADKEGAHSDAYYNETLELIEGIVVWNDSIKPHYAIAIGEYILSQTKPIAEQLTYTTVTK